MHSLHNILKNQHGGMVFRLVLLVVTFAIVAASIFWLLQNRQKEQARFHRKATELSELGLQVAMENLNQNTAWADGIAKTEAEGGWYAVAMKKEIRQDTVFMKIESEGHMGSVSIRKTCIVSLSSVNGTPLWIHRSMM